MVPSNMSLAATKANVDGSGGPRATTENGKITKHEAMERLYSAEQTDNRPTKTDAEETPYNNGLR